MKRSYAHKKKKKKKKKRYPYILSAIFIIKMSRGGSFFYDVIQYMAWFNESSWKWPMLKYSLYRIYHLVLNAKEKGKNKRKKNKKCDAFWTHQIRTQLKMCTTMQNFNITLTL